MMKIKFAQYGISHDHATGKTRVMRENENVELCGVFEPSPDVRDWLGENSVYEGVRWYSSKEKFLDDDSIQCIACQGR
ncbi:MAG: hypothetical protein QF437_17385, partial [Planctomycetota bacterium]|nr:hypothetical protein [Planctomycetota bacterium]